jgi:hypothetical protein
MSSHTGGMGSFGDLIAQMDQLGFFTGLLPFVITYTIFFFFLRKIAEGPMGLDEGDGNRADLFAALLSIAFAFFTSRFIMAHPYFQDFFSQFIGRFTVIAIGLLGLLVLLGFVGIDFEQRNSVGYILALLVVAAFAVSGGVSSILPLQSRNEIISSAAAFLSFTIETGLIFVFLIFGLLWWTMGSEDKEGPKNPFYYLFNQPEEESGEPS